jgi:hypothetical protein
LSFETAISTSRQSSSKARIDMMLPPPMCVMPANADAARQELSKAEQRQRFTGDVAGGSFVSQRNQRFALRQQIAFNGGKRASMRPCDMYGMRAGGESFKGG